MATKQKSVIAAGLALFSMFFGAGDLIWPVILGGNAGSMNLSAVLGLLVSGVTLPLLGLMSMMLFRGDYRAFFGQIGSRAGWVVILVIQAILGPFGTLPRLMTLCYATLKTNLAGWMTEPIFTVLACLIILLFTLKRHRVVELLGLILCPLLLLTLGTLLAIGLLSPHHAPEIVNWSSGKAFYEGLNVGYNTLDLIASFIFAPLVLSYFYHKEDDDQRSIFKKMIGASLLAACLLSGMYFGLTYLSSFYTPSIDHAIPPEGRLAAISNLILGGKGGLVSCIAISLSCLTTAIPISMISSEYIQKDLCKNKINLFVATVISLTIAGCLANLGFMGIAQMLSPILQILCPGLIILSVLNICHKVYEMRMRRAPVFIAFGLSVIGYFLHQV